MVVATERPRRISRLDISTGASSLGVCSLPDAKKVSVKGCLALGVGYILRVTSSGTRTNNKSSLHKLKQVDSVFVECQLQRGTPAVYLVMSRKLASLQAKQ